MDVAVHDGPRQIGFLQVIPIGKTVTVCLPIRCCPAALISPLRIVLMDQSRTSQHRIGGNLLKEPMSVTRVKKFMVLRLVQIANRDYPDWVIGKKTLQKSLYFAGPDNGLFRFRWEDYGPYSGEAMQIACDLVATGRIAITKTKVGSSGIPKKGMTYVSGPPDFEVPRLIEAAIGKAMKFAAGRSPRDLELLASVHFWARRVGREDAVKYSCQMLDGLKPYSVFTSEEVAWAVKCLAVDGFLFLKPAA